MSDLTFAVVVASNGILTGLAAWLCLSGAAGMGSLGGALPTVVRDSAVPVAAIGGMVATAGLVRLRAIPDSARRQTHRWIGLALCYPFAVGLISALVLAGMFLVSVARTPSDLIAAALGALVLAPFGAAIVFARCWPLFVIAGLVIVVSDYWILRLVDGDAPHGRRH